MANRALQAKLEKARRQAMGVDAIAPRFSDKAGQFRPVGRAPVMGPTKAELRAETEALVAAFTGTVKRGAVAVARGAFRGVPGSADMQMSLLPVSQGCGVSFQKASVVWSRDVAPRLIKK